MTSTSGSPSPGGGLCGPTLTAIGGWTATAAEAHLRTPSPSRPSPGASGTSPGPSPASLIVASATACWWPRTRLPQQRRRYGVVPRRALPGLARRARRPGQGELGGSARTPLRPLRRSHDFGPRSARPRRGHPPRRGGRCAPGPLECRCEVLVAVGTGSRPQDNSGCAQVSLSRGVPQAGGYRDTPSGARTATTGRTARGNRGLGSSVRGARRDDLSTRHAPSGLLVVALLWLAVRLRPGEPVECTGRPSSDSADCVPSRTHR